MTGRTTAVIVLNWNGGDVTLDCLSSIEASDFPGLRVYVVDNGSVDGSLERIREQFPQARILANGVNLGFCGGNNCGWHAALAEGADRVLFLNNDAILAPDTVRLLNDALDAHADIGAVSPRIFYGSGPDAGSQEVWFEKGTVTLHRFRVAVHVPARDEERISAFYDSETICGCAVLIGSELLTATGGFDEGFFAYYEDVDLSLKIRHAGFRCAVVPAAHAWHRVSASTGGSRSPTCAFYLSRNSRFLARRHADEKTWRQYRRGFLYGLLRSVAFYGRHNLKAGAAALQGGACALLGRRGARPTGFPT